MDTRITSFSDPVGCGSDFFAVPAFSICLKIFNYLDIICRMDIMYPDVKKVLKHV